MEIKNKEVIAFGLTVLMILGIASFPGCSAAKTKEKLQDDTTSFSDDSVGSAITKATGIFENTIKEVVVDVETIKNIKLDEYNDNFDKETYYVHSNDKRTILSKKDTLEGYELQGIYTSLSSAEEIVYMITDNGDGTVTCKTVSYDNMDKMTNRDAVQFYVINEDSLVDAFVPYVIIVPDKGTSKKLK